MFPCGLAHVQMLDIKLKVFLKIEASFHFNTLPPIKSLETGAAARFRPVLLSALRTLSLIVT